MYVATLFLLEFFSTPTDHFASFFNAENTYQRYATVLAFRMIANLHCYNPTVSPPGQKDLLINTIAHHCTHMVSVTEDFQVIRLNKVPFPFFAQPSKHLFIHSFSLDNHSKPCYKPFGAVPASNWDFQFYNARVGIMETIFRWTTSKTWHCVSLCWTKENRAKTQTQFTQFLRYLYFFLLSRFRK